MRPLKVEFQAFGPYAGHELVDLEALSAKGLFLICGKTGIGKTMILDAMTFALYGKSSGHGRDVFEDMRCTNADHDKTTFVKFEFENQGRYYLFERRLERKRINLSASYNLMERAEGENWRVVLENAKEKALNDKAEEIIGLKYDQFCQVIILPQGKFEKLLTSPSDEKEGILTSIFGQYRWQMMANCFYDEAEKRKNGLKTIKDRIERSLAEEGCETIPELLSAVAGKTELLTALDAEYEKADPDRTIKEQNELLAIANRFTDLSNAQKKLDELYGQKDEKKRWEKTLYDARRAGKVRAQLEGLDEAQRSCEKRRKALEEAKRSEEDAKRAADEAAKALKAHVAREEEAEEKKNLIIAYTEKRKDYESIDKAEEDLKCRKEAVDAAKGEEQKAQDRYKTLSEAAVTKRNEYESLTKQHSVLLCKYLEGITGELARDLVAGQPCPVCGSTEHPHKAGISKSGVTEDMVNAKKDECDDKYGELSDTTALLNEAKSVLDEKKRALVKAEAEVTVAEAAVRKLSENFISGISSLKELDEEIAKLGKEVRSYADAKAGLEKAQKAETDAYNEARTKTGVAQEEANDAEASYRAAEKEAKKALADNSFSSREEAAEMMMSPEDMEALGNKTAGYEASVKAAEEALAQISAQLEGIKEPDGDKCRERLNEAINAKGEYHEKRAGLDIEIKRLQKKVEDLEKEGDRIEEKIREAEDDLVFAKRLRGDTGTGLQRYVLGIMFSSVVAAANRMLEMVHGGRYRLYRSDERTRGAKKRGLELKVYDKYSQDHEGRFVSTLSGGEKFLASLALSIGMSAIARQSGIRIEALFIDEGFGSLDDESIADAMSVLNSIQEANGLVGIISHVQILQDQIPCKLMVEADSSGSHIVQTLG